MQRNLGANDEQFRNSEFRDRIRRRDREAWDQLFRTYASRLGAVARRVLPARLDPEGAAQQTWMLALAKASRFARKRNSSETPYPWLCSICINWCISLLRKDKVRGRPHVVNSLLQSARLRSPLGQLVSEGSLDAAAEAGEDLRLDLGADLGRGFSQQDLRRSMAKLPRALQAVLYLRFFCGFPMATVAQSLHISRDAVRQRLCRAYRMLREDLGQGGVE